MAAPDRFGSRARAYAEFRPDYPAGLLDFVAALPARRDRAWDCATGSGQAAVGLAERFATVVASDVSAAQLAHARPHPRVVYLRAAAEASALADRSVDLVAVAQALHWLDLPRFHDEVRRVLVPGGALAAWTYGDPELLHPRLDAVLRRFDHDTLDAWWAPARRHVRSGYRELPFPFDERDAPELALERAWTLPELVGYVRSWSAVAACAQATGTDPVAALEADLARRWGDPRATVRVRWPLRVRAGLLSRT
jgi:SAM-dependent methyltransferase